MCTASQRVLPTVNTRHICWVFPVQKYGCLGEYMVILQMINTDLGIRTVVMSKISTQYSNIVANIVRNGSNLGQEVKLHGLKLSN